MNPWTLIRRIGESLSKSSESLACTAVAVLPDRAAASALAALGVICNVVGALALEAAESKDGRDLDDVADELRSWLAGNSRQPPPPVKAPALTPSAN